MGDPWGHKKDPVWGNAHFVQLNAIIDCPKQVGENLYFGRSNWWKPICREHKSIFNYKTKTETVFSSNG